MSILDFVPPTKKETLLSSSSRRKGVMLCYPLEEKRLLKWTPPFFVQPKLDGERCRELEGGLLVSSECNPIISLPHINAALQSLRARLYDSLTSHLTNIRLDGELYVHGWSFEQIHSCVSRTVNPHPNAHKIKFYVFDLWNSTLPQYERTSDLLKMQKYFPDEIVLVPTKICNSLDEILAANDSFVGEGYEGIIVREPSNLYVSREENAYRSPYVMKFKPKKSDEYEIVEIYPAWTASGECKNLVGSILCKDAEGNNFSISPGTGWTDERKKELYRTRKLFIGKKLLVEYQNLTADRGVPRFGRFPFNANKHLEIL